MILSNLKVTAQIFLISIKNTVVHLHMILNYSEIINVMNQKNVFYCRNRTIIQRVFCDSPAL